MLYPWLEPYYRQVISAVDSGRMTGSVIISGSEGLGVNALALEIAKFYLCHDRQSGGYCDVCRSCLSFNRYYHQDLKVAYTSSAEEAKSGADFSSDLSALLSRDSGDARRSMRIDTVRRVSEFLSESAVAGKGKAVIICGADSMSEEAANAVLKTFEEPAPDTLIIMLTRSLELLLPTVLSRAFKLVIRDIPLRQSLDYLLDKANQYPRAADAESAADPDLSFEERRRLVQEAREKAAAACEGLRQPIDETRAAVALSLTSFAPLDAMELLLGNTDQKALSVLHAFKDALVQGPSADSKVTGALLQLDGAMQSRLLGELVLETLKYKAGVPEDELPLLKYGQITDLHKIRSDNLFEAVRILKYLECRAPQIPVKAGAVLIRAWLTALRQ